MKTAYLKYVLPAISIIAGMAMCVAYSLNREDPLMLWGGLLLITAVSMATYALFSDSE